MSQHIALMRKIATDTTLTPTAIRIALLFATLPEGAWQSMTQSRLAERIGCTEYTARAALRDLERVGYIERKRRYTGVARFAYRLAVTEAA